MLQMILNPARFTLRPHGILLSAALLLATHPAFAQYASDAYTARALALGGAVRALATDTTALEMNPAAIATFGDYELEGGYRFFPAQRGHQYRFGIIDNVTSRIASGLSYTIDSADAIPGPPRTGWTLLGEDPTPIEAWRSQDYILGFALPFSLASVGTSLIWHRFKQGDADELDAINLQSLFTFTLGAVLKPSDFFQVALVGTNLIPTGRSERPTTLGFGFGAWLKSYAAGGVDVSADFTGKKDESKADTWDKSFIRININVGGQLVFWQFLPVRLGYYTEGATNARYLTTGTGIEAGRLRLSYGLRYQLAAPDLNRSDRFFHSFMLGLRFSPTAL